MYILTCYFKIARQTARKPYEHSWICQSQASTHAHLQLLARSFEPQVTSFKRLRLD